MSISFGEAIKALKEGERVSRSGWNGTNMWLALSPGVKDLESDKFWSQAIREFGETHGVKTISVLPYIVMYTKQGEIVPWLASQTDILSEDWSIVS